MLPTVTLKQLAYSTPDSHSLFTGLDLAFGAHRTGLIGRNGTGKTTLLKLITGELTPTRGDIAIVGSVGVLRQSTQLTPGETIADRLGIAADLARLARLDTGAGSLDDASEADWTLPARLQTVFADLGLPPLAPTRLLDTVSGGQRTRIGLAALLLQRPDIILLDEPTNNLDADGRAAIAQLLRQWRGCAIVVSHDRTLLDQMDAIVELTTLGATTYGGNWQFYSDRKAIELAAAGRDLATAERRVGDIERKLQQVAERKTHKDSAGARKATRGDAPKILLGARKDNAEKTSGENARLAGRQRAEAANAATDARAQVEILTPLAVKLATTGLSRGKTVLQADALTGGPVADAPIIRNLSLQLIGPERVAITGANGSGKTTLLRLLTGALAPTAGTVRIFVRHALLDQTVSLLDPSLSIHDNFRALNPDAEATASRTALARFMFRADAALQRVESLSGGEILRAGIATTIGSARPPELLILDEPTNHLDIDAVQAIEAGLRSYDGALLVVSHDARFLANIGITRQIVL